ncbi:MAG: hypothetical protein WEC75_08995 [Dehalococcoidia bacterium]
MIRFASTFLVGSIMVATLWAAMTPVPPSRAGTEEISLAIDADTTNGTRPCDPIDVSRSLRPGTSYQVAVCLVGASEAPNALTTAIIYNREFNQAPEQSPPSLSAAECDDPDIKCLDSNPDLNDTKGDQSSGESVGSGWDCTAFGIAIPRGDEPRSEEADASITCYANILEPDATLAASPGLVTLTTFEALTEGTDDLSLSPVSSIFGLNCAPYGTMACRGAQITISNDAPVATSPAPSPGTGGSGESTPAAAPTDESPDGDEQPGSDDGLQPWVYALIAMGGAALLGLAVLAVVRRRS